MIFFSVNIFAGQLMRYILSHLLERMHVNNLFEGGRGMGEERRREVEGGFLT